MKLDVIGVKEREKKEGGRERERERRREGRKRKSGRKEERKRKKGEVKGSRRRALLLKTPSTEERFSLCKLVSEAFFRLCQKVVRAHSITAF